MIIQTTDFIGGYKISTDNFSQLDNYILQFEPKYLKAILGDTIYTDIEANPTFDKYADLLGDSLKEALIGFIYFHYVSDNFLNTTVGNTFNNNENSSMVGNQINAQISVNRFNTACDLINTDVYDWLIDYYSEETTSTTSSEVATTYTVLVPSTKYLNVGLNVTIDSVEYEITSLTTDTSIVFTAPTGMSFAAKDIKWYPYYEKTANNINEIVI